MVPNAVRVDHGDRSLFANLEATGLGTVDLFANFWRESASHLLNGLPSIQPFFASAALWFFWVGTNKKVAFHQARVKVHPV
jgi:hypothetical protein